MSKVKWRKRRIVILKRISINAQLDYGKQGAASAVERNG